MVERSGSCSEDDASLDRALAALADPTRRAILASLRRGPATVGEVAAPFPISLNAVSKHIRVLEQAGLVARDVRGREHHLSLDAEPLRDVARFASGYARFWEGRLDALARLFDEPDAGEAR